MFQNQLGCCCVGASTGVTVNSELFQCLGQGADVVLTQHVALYFGFQSLHHCEFGLGLRKVLDSRRQVKETIHIVLD